MTVHALSRRPGCAPRASRRPAAQGAWAVFLAAALSIASGLIHVSASVDHAGEYALFGVFFAVLAVAQFAWSAEVLRRPSPRLLAGGAWLSGLTALLWLLSRTTGLPIGPDPWHPEAVGVLDVLSTVDELLIVALLVPSLLGPVRTLGLRLAPAFVAASLIVFTLGTHAH